MSEGYTFVQRVVELFFDRPNEWVDARDLMVAGGICAWRTRVSDARKQYGLTIENRTQRVTLEDGRTITRSLYRYVPQVRLDRG